MSAVHGGRISGVESWQLAAVAPDVRYSVFNPSHRSTKMPGCCKPRALAKWIRVHTIMNTLIGLAP